MAQNTNTGYSHVMATSLQSNNSQCDSPSTFYTAVDITERDIIIAVMGPTGAGKSTFIQHATGTNDIQIGHNLESCTVDVRAFHCSHPDGQRNIVFVDTPGFDDTNRRDTEILESIANWLQNTYRVGIKLSAVLYLHRITDNRITKTVLRNYDMFAKLCGKKALSNVVLVTTHWERLETPEEGTRREQELRTDFWKSFLEDGSQILRFEHCDRDSAWKIVDLLPLVPQPLEIQQEMVDQGKPLNKTGAGRILFSWFDEKLRDLLHRIKDLWERVSLSREVNESPDEAVQTLLQEEMARWKELEQQKGRLQFGRRASLRFPVSFRSQPPRAPQAHPRAWLNRGGQSNCGSGHDGGGTL